MKKLLTLSLMTFHCLFFAQKTTPVFYVLEEPLVIGSIDKSNHILMELDKDKLVKTINNYMSKNDVHFDSVHVDKTDVDRKTFYFLVFTTRQSNKALVRWLNLKDTRLIIENTQEKDYASLNTYFTCEGEQSCYPRLKKVKDQYGWSCRDSDACVSETYAKEHPCICTKSIIGS